MQNLPTILNRELLRQESTPSETGSLEIALQDTRIRNADTESIKQALRLVMLKLGLRAANMPNEQEKAVLIAHLITNYSNHTPKEIILAFEMAITGRLEIEEKEVNCYENFSCLYVSKILNAYRLWAAKEVQYIKPKVLIEDKKEITREEKLETIADWESRKEIILAFIPPYLYSWLVEEGKINLSVKEKCEIRDRAIEIRKSELFQATENRNPEAVKEYMTFIEMKESGEIRGLEVEKIKLLSYKLSVLDYLNRNLKI